MTDGFWKIYAYVRLYVRNNNSNFICHPSSVTLNGASKRPEWSLQTTRMEAPNDPNGAAILNNVTQMTQMAQILQIMIRSHGKHGNLGKY